MCVKKKLILRFVLNRNNYNLIARRQKLLFTLLWDKLGVVGTRNEK